MKRIALIAVVSASLTLIPGGIAAADPDSGTGASPGKTPPGAGQTNAPKPATAAPAAASSSDAPTAKLGSEPTGSLSPATKSTLAAEVASVDTDMAEVTAAVETIHNDPAMTPEAVQAADAEVDVLTREQQIIHEIAVEEGFEPTPDTVPAASVPTPPVNQPAVTRAAVTGDLYAALALLDSRNAVAPIDPVDQADRHAHMALLLDALRAAEQSGDPQAIETARAAIESVSAANELTVLEQTTAKLLADADRVLQGYTIPVG